MHLTKPEVYLVAQTRVNLPDMKSYLQQVGGANWLGRMLDADVETEGKDFDANLLSEFAGRSCYRSWEPGLNANVTKIRQDTSAYLRNIIEVEHGSVLEHTSVSFMFHNVSRVFTHELVRHRVGIAISQESLRYVRLTNLGFRVPPALEPLEQEVIQLVERLEEFQLTAAQRLKLDDEGVSFAYKKEVTSALRRLAPIGLSTGMLWTSNLRTLRYVLGKRTELSAEEEIRLVFDMVGRRVTQEYPVLFSDFERQENGVWLSPHAKA